MMPRSRHPLIDRDEVELVWDGERMSLDGKVLDLRTMRPLAGALVDFLAKTPMHRASNLEIGRALYGSRLRDEVVAERARTLIARTRQLLNQRFGDHIKWLHYSPTRKDIELIVGFNLNITIMEGWRPHGPTNKRSIIEGAGPILQEVRRIPSGPGLGSEDDQGRAGQA